MMNLVVLLMRLLRLLPLPVLRSLGVAVGSLLWNLAKRRRHIVEINLKMCFPELNDSERERLGKKNFIRVVQALLDRSWLWLAPEHLVRARVRLVLDPTVSNLLKNQNDSASQTYPLVIFAPHFVGLDAGWSALCLELGQAREMVTIFTQQPSPAMDEWVYGGRKRFGRARLFRKVQGVSEIARAVQAGAALYLLPDMDFGAEDSIFVPFFSVNAATVTSLPRFARIGRAQVLSAVTHLVKDGYEVRLSVVWADYPSGDLTLDTVRMNRELEALINQCPDQYYWVHRRFKTRPPGEPAVYQ
jgi:Kdo2-lipid IVA lauroyltransferase/acyltransferase